MKKPGKCLRCDATTDWLLHRKLFNNASENFVWICSMCRVENPGRSHEHWIPKAKVLSVLTPEQADELPVLMSAFRDRCRVCFERGAELHHWAPRAIFGKEESELWPQDYLCRACHTRWHQLVTPGLIQ